MNQETRRARREQTRRRTVRRRRLTAGAALAVLVLAIVVALATGGGGGGGDRTASADRLLKPPPTLPDGTRSIFPRHRVIALYGASGSKELGALGETSPDQAARRLVRQAAPYRRAGRPVMLAFELIATLATSSPGSDGNYRRRSSDKVIARYLAAARRAHALLILDIQPGHADFLKEAKAYRKWLAKPDVGLALDAEWSLPRGQVPGQYLGSTDAATVNRVSAWLQGIAQRRRLPQKLLIVHQFTPGMVRHRSDIIRRPSLATTINIDGFGEQANKISKYRELTRGLPTTPTRASGAPHARRKPRRPAPRPFYTGFKVFYSSKMDPDMMSPKQVLHLKPSPDIIEYE